jgi:TPR repeat protein
MDVQKSLIAAGLLALAPTLAAAAGLPPRAQNALARGDVRAEVRLGAIYDQGRGVAPDPVVAAKLYRDAARQGSGAAQLNLAKLYLEGRGVEADHVAAYAWADAAAASGEPGGQRIIDALAKSMPPAQLSRAESLAERYTELYVRAFRAS